MNAIKNAALSMISYLSSSMVPPNTPLDECEKLRAVNHMESKKFYIVLTSVIILAFFYFSTIFIMFLIPASPEYVSGFVTIFSKTIEILAIIIASYVGAQAVVDLRYASSSASSLSSLNENIKDITVIQTNTKEEDYELK